MLWHLHLAISGDGDGDGWLHCCSRSRNYPNYDPHLQIALVHASVQSQYKRMCNLPANLSAVLFHKCIALVRNCSLYLSETENTTQMRPTSNITYTWPASKLQNQHRTHARRLPTMMTTQRSSYHHLRPPSNTHDNK